METFIIKLSVATFPLVVLVSSVIIASTISHTYHPLSWHRRRRSILKTMAAGVMLR